MADEFKMCYYMGRTTTHIIASPTGILKKYGRRHYGSGSGENLSPDGSVISPATRILVHIDDIKARPDLFKVIGEGDELIEDTVSVKNLSYEKEIQEKEDQIAQLQEENLKLQEKLTGLSELKVKLEEKEAKLGELETKLKAAAKAAAKKKPASKKASSTSAK